LESAISTGQQTPENRFSPDHSVQPVGGAAAPLGEIQQSIRPDQRGGKSPRPPAFGLDREPLILASFAVHSRDTAGRRHYEAPHPYRGPFQRDRDRILHSSAFRRLSGKMQVFTGDMGEYHRTRLTHTFEVASVARTIARVLRLNEDLVEALALMHDIGHPPYGHCGEDVLDACLRSVGGFSHNQFALTIVEELEQRFSDSPGLNLSAEVLAGQDVRAHKEAAAIGDAPILEVQIVDAADSMAYDAHDMDDAVQMGLLAMDHLGRLAVVGRARDQVKRRHGYLPPARLRQALVHELIDLQVSDFIENALEQLVPYQSRRSDEICTAGVRLTHSRQLADERRELEQFLFDNVYRHPKLLQVRQAAEGRLEALFGVLSQNPGRLPLRFRMRAERTSAGQAAGEYLAGMTDRFCDTQYRQLHDHQGPLADWS
jgi:dGTPase